MPATGAADPTTRQVGRGSVTSGAAGCRSPFFLPLFEGNTSAGVRSVQRGVKTRKDYADRMH